MYIDTTTVKLASGKTYTRHLLRRSVRVDGKVQKETIANLSHCKPEEVEAIRFALRHPGDVAALAERGFACETRQGLSVGAVILINLLATRLHIRGALGNSRQAKLVLWLVMTQLIAPGSRLHAVRLARQHAVCEVLGLGGFNEDDLYAALDWACEQQARIEDRLFQRRYGSDRPCLYLYDVTSSYLEGDQNELSAFGYNRDKKRGKKQIVFGLLTDNEGFPLSIEAFRGNTSDPQTVLSQIRTMAQRFGVSEVTLVGDRGMIKQCQIEDLADHNFHYITAITKPQIEALIRRGVFQLELFAERVFEVQLEGVRHVLRRNPVRAAEIEINRQEKIAAIRALAAEQTTYLTNHMRARPAVALRKVNALADRLRVAPIVQVALANRRITVGIDTDAHSEAARLDGCYVIKTDLAPEVAATAEIHDRYKDLIQVEFAFRTMKLDFLNVRPWFVRKESRTRGHLVVVMLAYAIARELRDLWQELDCKVDEGLAELSALTSIGITIGGESIETIPAPRDFARDLLAAAAVTLPSALPSRSATVDTRKKLPSARATS